MIGRTEILFREERKQSADFRTTHNRNEKQQRARGNAPREGGTRRRVPLSGEERTPRRVVHERAPFSPLFAPPSSSDTSASSGGFAACAPVAAPFARLLRQCAVRRRSRTTCTTASLWTCADFLPFARLPPLLLPGLNAKIPPRCFDSIPTSFLPSFLRSLNECRSTCRVLFLFLRGVQRPRIFEEEEERVDLGKARETRRQVCGGGGWKGDDSPNLCSPRIDFEAAIDEIAGLDPFQPRRAKGLPL